jgi:hypothetical protein
LYTLYLGTEFSFGEFTFEHVLIIHSVQSVTKTCKITHFGEGIMVGGGGDCSPTLELWYAAASSPDMYVML